MYTSIKVWSYNARKFTPINTDVILTIYFEAKLKTFGCIATTLNWKNKLSLPYKDLNMKHLTAIPK